MGNATIFGENSIFQSLNTIGGAVFLAEIFIVLAAFALLIHITKLPFIILIRKFIVFIGKKFAKIVHKQEKAYHRDVEIGKLDAKRTTVKFYSFLQDLIIDLQLLHTGITPYEFMWITIIATTLLVAFVCKLLFGSFLFTIIVAPIAIVGVFCVMYTKANLAHDQRIEDVIEAENIICNNIKVGVVVAVRESLDTLPRSVRPDFKAMLDNVELKNYHIKTALQELNMNLGGIADDFIKKCIVFEMEEEHGISGMFQDIVEINNIKMEMRTEAKRRFEEVKQQFIIGAGMIFIFLGGVIGIYPNVREFYFTKFIGQLVLILDLLLLIIEFVYITYLRAQEL